MIESFVDGVEKQTEESVANYKKRRRIEIVKDSDEEGHVREVHQGLSNETWDLPTIFGEYFPSLQRRSALLTLCSYFEHELDKLCLLYQSEKSLDISYTDLREMGVDRSTRYLEKVAGINVHQTSQEWNDIKNIQKIRNALVHRGDKLQDHNDETFARFVKKAKSLSRTEEEEIVLGKGFLSYVVRIYTQYFKLIGDSIATRENA